MNINNILREFVKDCGKKLNLYGIIQFGSSTYSKNFGDIDLIFLSNRDILPTKDILKLIKIIKDFENKYGEIVFDFGGIATRKRKAKYPFTVIFFGKEILKIRYNPHDILFLKSISKDRSRKILFGRDPFSGFNFKLTNRYLYEKLSVDLLNTLRNTLDDDGYKFDALYKLFKKFLRDLLINERGYKKEELLEKFKSKFENKIKLPKNSRDILENKLKKEDFKDILKFSEDCLRYLSK